MIVVTFMQLCLVCLVLVGDGTGVLLIIKFTRQNCLFQNSNSLNTKRLITRLLRWSQNHDKGRENVRGWRRKMERGKRREETRWVGALLERNRSPSTCFIGLPESKAGNSNIETSSESKLSSLFTGTSTISGPAYYLFESLL